MSGLLVARNNENKSHRIPCSMHCTRGPPGLRVFLCNSNTQQGKNEMARSRTIKPGFFDNEHIAQCSSDAQLAFIATWMLSDRDGYLENRPLRIRKFAFGYRLDDVDVHALLAELISAGLLVEVDPVDGQDWLWIPKFSKHQKPHRNEPSVYLSDAGSGNGQSESGNGQSGSDQSPSESRTGVNSKRETVRGKRETVRGEQKTRTRRTIDDATRTWFLTEFWPHYPLKTSRQPALEAAAKVPEAERPAMVAGLKRQLKWSPGAGCGLNPAREKLPHATTWIHQRRWEDMNPDAGRARQSPFYPRSAPEQRPVHTGQVMEKIMDEIGKAREKLPHHVQPKDEKPK